MDAVDELVGQLRAKGYRAFTLPYTASGKTLHRVRVGISDFIGLALGRAMIVKAGLLLHCLMQAPTQGYIGFLKTTTNRKQGQASGDRAANQGQGQRIAFGVQRKRT